MDSPEDQTGHLIRSIYQKFIFNLLVCWTELVMSAGDWLEVLLLIIIIVIIKRSYKTCFSPDCLMIIKDEDVVVETLKTSNTSKKNSLDWKCLTYQQWVLPRIPLGFQTQRSLFRHRYHGTDPSLSPSPEQKLSNHSLVTLTRQHSPVMLKR